LSKEKIDPYSLMEGSEDIFSLLADEHSKTEGLSRNFTVAWTDQNLERFVARHVNLAEKFETDIKPLDEKFAENLTRKALLLQEMYEWDNNKTETYISEGLKTFSPMFRQALEKDAQMKLLFTRSREGRAFKAGVKVAVQQPDEAPEEKEEGKIRQMMNLFGRNKQEEQNESY